MPDQLAMWVELVVEMELTIASGDLAMLKAYTCIWSNQSAAEMVNF